MDEYEKLGDWIELELGLTPPVGWTEKMCRLHTLLITANKRVNLTRIQDEHAYVIRHLADSLLGLTAYPPLQTQPLQVADIGCGGGFPGLPLAVFCPQLQLTEIDSIGKKVACVAEFATALALANVSTLCGRVRELTRQDAYRSAFQLVTARAVGPAERVVKEGVRLLKPGGVLLIYSTPEKMREEEQRVRREAGKAACSIAVSADYALPDAAGQRKFWILQVPD